MILGIREPHFALVFRINRNTHGTGTFQAMRNPRLVHDWGRAGRVGKAGLAARLADRPIPRPIAQYVPQRRTLGFVHLFAAFPCFAVEDPS